jgi:hypothetical protein
METLDYLNCEKIRTDERVEFLVVQVGDVPPRDSLYTAISHVRIFKSPSRSCLYLR